MSEVCPVTDVGCGQGGRGARLGHHVSGQVVGCGNIGRGALAGLDGDHSAKLILKGETRRGGFRVKA